MKNIKPTTMKKFKLALVSVIVIFFTTQCTVNTEVPFPTVNSALENGNEYPDGYFPAEEAWIQVLVDGSTLSNPSVKADVDIVFILDRSRSILETDPLELCRTTVASSILTGLNTSQHRTNVVTFNDHANFVCDDITTLTTNYNRLSSCLLGILSPDGYTNMAAGMDLANELLTTTGANHRIAILFTDGYPMTNPYEGYDIEQDAYITNTIIPYAIDNDIVYNVVYLNTDPIVMPGSEEEAYVTSLINNICTRTGGRCFTIDDASELLDIFGDIIEENGNTLYLKNLSMNLNINDAYSFVNTSSYITTGLTYQVTGNQITTTPISRLLQNQRISLTFKATCFEPIAPEEEVIDRNIPVFTSDAKIFYDLGDDVQRFKVVPQISIKWLKPPSVLVKKSIEPSSREMTIKVINYIRETEISDVALWEIVAGNMEIRLNTCDPIPTHIFGPNYRSRETFDYEPEKLFYRLGNLETFESASVKFNYNYFGSISGTHGTDFGKPSAALYYTLPDGRREELLYVCENNNECWRGERFIDADEYALENEILSPDFNIRSRQIIPQKEYYFDLPIARTYEIWNDSYHNGWLPFVTSEHFTTPDPLNMGNKNKTWFHIDQFGNALPNANLNVRLFLKDDFSYSIEDYTDDQWILLGQKELLTENEVIVDYIEYDPRDVLSDDQQYHFSRLSKAWYKIVIDYPNEELRKNNNISFKEINIINE